MTRFWGYVLVAPAALGLLVLIGMLAYEAAHNPVLGRALLISGTVVGVTLMAIAGIVRLRDGK